MTASAPTTTTPRGEARRRAFLDAAREVFLAQGLEAASVNDVVRLAGGSLATLYSQFGSKEGLFLAMFEDGIENLLAPLRELSAVDMPIREGLMKIGQMFIHSALSPRAVGIWRIVVSEARTYPHLAERFMAVGPERVRAAVRSYLEERHAHGEVRDIDADWAASYFAEMLRARHLFNAATDPTYAPTREELDECVARTVDILLNGIAAR